MSGYAVFDIMSWVVLTNIASYRGISPTSTICFAMALASLSMGAGVFLAQLLNATISDSAIISAITTMVTYFLVLGAVLALVDISGIWNKISDKDGMAAQEKEISILADDHGLTKRETEVLFTLITSSSASDIAEQLHVSQNTLNTHIKRIYTKTNVHSRKELIEYVNSWLN